MNEAVDSPEQIRDMVERVIESGVRDLKEGDTPPEPLREVTKNVLIYFDEEAGTEEAARQAIQPLIEQCRKQHPHFKIDCQVDKSVIQVHVSR